MTSLKKIILLITLLLTAFFSLLPAQEHEDFAMVSIYELRGESFVYESNRSKTLFKDINVTLTLLKSNDATLNISNIKEHDKTYHNAFISIAKKETFQETNTTYWLKVNLGDAFPSGRFVYSYGDADFTEHTFLPSQMLEKFVLDGHQKMKFSYVKDTDPQSYYFKLAPRHFKEPFRFLYVSTPETFYAYLEKQNNIQLILGLIMGLILMAGIYNAAMYYYNKEVSFLYYALMQFFMISILYVFSGAFLWDEGSYFSRNISFQSILSISASLFATLFSMYFLETKQHLPKLHKLYLLAILILGIDLIISIFYESLLVRYYLLPFLMLGLIYAGYKRMRQGYKPARFYLAGWTVLNLAVFLNIFMLGYEYTIIDPLYIGSAIEAILFSLALSFKMRMVANEKEEQKELLVHQSKLASMGEMIANIAHQWRQPLTHLSYTFMNIKEAQKHGELNESYLNKKVDEATLQLDFMSQTIDDFKDFYLPNKEKENFSLLTATEETLDIMKNTLKLSDIEVELVLIGDTQVHNYKNEYKQVLLNLLSNAKNALIERVTKTPKISIVINKDTVSVEDNAGGIDDKVLPRIFEPYFSTKKDNSGIGLYMSKMIVERNMGAKLLVQNSTKGAKFIIDFI
jgi:signal transduction histidine kinase